MSVVVVNRDGVRYLRRLLPGLAHNTDYANLELILVDNGSSDDSLDFIRGVETRLPISIVSNPHNESFADACNQGAELAAGELLLFLNNDIEPFDSGWLLELVACLRTRAAGIAGSTLICPSDSSEKSYRVQHGAMRLVEEAGLLRADLHGRGDDPLGDGFGEDAETPLATGACILIERDLFREVGGFTRRFFYGGEDVDLGWKVLARGRRIVCSGRSFLIHRLGSTRKEAGAERQAAIGRGNRRLLWERWGPRLRREYELDRIEEVGFWTVPGPWSGEPPTREQALALGYCLRSTEPAPVADRLLRPLGDELARRGHRFATLHGDRCDDLVGLNYDVAVYLRGPARYIPKPGQLNVLWAVSHLDAVTPTECSRYDLVVTTDADLAVRLREVEIPTPITLMDRGKAAGELIDAVHTRAREIAFPTRI